ncbi:hypothetical protein K8I28_00470 [bacterium]|nr:hypothetical protein [bacterium]
MKKYVLILPVLMLGLIASFAHADDRALDSPMFLNPQSEATVEVENAGWGEMLEQKLPLSNRRYELQKQLAQDAMEEEGEEYGDDATSNIPEGGFHPGRAVLMSALIPGAGQLYSGAHIKSALFFALEIGLWVGAINYGLQGDDKDAEFKVFADENWNDAAYREYEFWLARWYNNRTNQINDVFLEDRNAWDSFNWQDQLAYLPSWFTHELPDDKTQQYYEMIGKYLQQFGIGWEDEWNNDQLPEVTDFTDPDQVNLWADVYFELTVVDTDDHWFKNNAHAEKYGDMRYDSNQLLDMRDNLFKLVMVNHVLSALDAGFTVVRNNRRLAEAQVGMDAKMIGGKLVSFTGLHFTW